MAKNLVIKTTMDNKDFDSKYSDLTRQLELAEQKLNNSKDTLNSYQRELQDVSRQYEILGESAEKTFQRIAELENKMNDPSKSITSTEYNEYNDLVKSYEKMSKELSSLETKQDSLTNKVNSTNVKVKQEETNVSKVNQKMEQLKNTTKDIDVSNMSSGMEKLIKKVSKWGLALIGIRSAYSAIRMSINTMTQYDDQLKADMEYLQYGLAMTLKPLVEALVPLIFQVLNAINQIVYSISGINLFANSMAKGFKSASGSAKELKKTLAGFDTANVLNDSGSGTGGVNGTGLSTQYNLGEVNDKSLLSSLTKTFNKIQEKVYSFFGKIKDNILSLIVGTDWYSPISLVIDGIGNIIKSIGGIVGDVFALIIGICSGNLELIKQSFSSLGQHIIQMFKGVIQLSVGKIGELFAAMSALISKATSLGSKFGETIKTQVGILINYICLNIEKISSTFSLVLNKIKTTASNIGTAIGNIIGGAIKSVVNWVISQVESKVNSVIRGINTVSSVINKIPGVNIGKISTLSLPRLATGGIINNPGRGVPIGGAIAGESGREGVLPLTDSQAMAQLGREIGQWISVNVDLTTKLDGRVLSRSLERVKENNSFARNGV